MICPEQTVKSCHATQRVHIHECVRMSVCTNRQRLASVWEDRYTSLISYSVQLVGVLFTTTQVCSKIYANSKLCGLLSNYMAKSNDPEKLLSSSQTRTYTRHLTKGFSSFINPSISCIKQKKSLTINLMWQPRSRLTIIYPLSKLVKQPLLWVVRHLENFKLDIKYSMRESTDN